MSGQLTPKQAIFIAEWLVDFNATRSAIAAGFSEKTAEAAGSRLLRNVKVAAAIAERKARRVEKLDVEAERVSRELAKLSFFDPGRLFDEHGKLKPVAELDEVTRAAVESVEIDPRTGRLKKVVMAKKGQNLERLGRTLGMFKDRVEHTGKLTLEQLVCGDSEAAGEPAHS